MKNKPLCLDFKSFGQKKHGSLVQNIKKTNPGIQENIQQLYSNKNSY